MYNITIIGPGLIGASLGLCLKKHALANKIHGVDIDKVNLKKKCKGLMLLTNLTKK